MLQMVRGNYKGFTKWEIDKVKETRRLQGMIGSPSVKEYESMTKQQNNNILRNSKITFADMADAKVIFGPSLSRLKGVLVRTKPPRESNYLSVLKEAVERSRLVEIVADVMFIYRLPFTISLLHQICFVTAQYSLVEQPLSCVIQ